MNNSVYPLYIEESDIPETTGEKIQGLVDWYRRTEKALLILEEDMKKIKEGIHRECRHSPAMANAILKVLEKEPFRYTQEV